MKSFKRIFKLTTIIKYNTTRRDEHVLNSCAVHINSFNDKLITNTYAEWNFPSFTLVLSSGSLAKL